MAARITGRDAHIHDIRLITPSVEVKEGVFLAARMWLEDPDCAGYFVAEMTAEGDLRTGMFFISDQDVCTHFRRVWGEGTQGLH